MLKINRSRKAKSTSTELLDDDFRAISFSDRPSPSRKNLANVSEPSILQLHCRLTFSFSMTEVGFGGEEIHTDCSSKEIRTMQVRLNQSNLSIRKFLKNEMHYKFHCRTNVRLRTIADKSEISELTPHYTTWQTILLGILPSISRLTTDQRQGQIVE